QSADASADQIDPDVQHHKVEFAVSIQVSRCDYDWQTANRIVLVREVCSGSGEGCGKNEGNHYRAYPDDCLRSTHGRPPCGIDRHTSRGCAQFSVPPLPRSRYSSAFRPGSSAQKIRATRGTAFMTGSASNSLGMKYRRIVRLEGREVNWNLKLAFETA